MTLIVNCFIIHPSITPYFVIMGLSSVQICDSAEAVDVLRPEHRAPDERLAAFDSVSSAISSHARAIFLRIALVTSMAFGGVGLVSSEADAKTSHSSKKKSKKNKPFVQFSSGVRVEKVSDPRLIGSDSRCVKLDPSREKDRRKIYKRCEYYDPRRMGVPLVRVKKSDLDRKVSKHFRVGDFARIDPKDVQYVREDDVISHDGGFYRRYFRVDKKLIDILEKIRVRARVGLTTDEGTRGYGENTRMYTERCVGKGRKAFRKCAHMGSMHIPGRAVDIVNDSPAIAHAAERVLQGTGGIGVGPTTIHVDDRAKKARWWY